MAAGISSIMAMFRTLSGGRSSVTRRTSAVSCTRMCLNAWLIAPPPSHVRDARSVFLGPQPPGAARAPARPHPLPPALCLEPPAALPAERELGGDALGPAGGAMLR